MSRVSATGSPSSSGTMRLTITYPSSDPKIIRLEPRIDLVKLGVDVLSKRLSPAPRQTPSTPSDRRGRREGRRTPREEEEEEEEKEHIGDEEPSLARSPAPRHSPSTPLDRRGGREGQRAAREEEVEDLLDEELSLGLRIGIGLDLSQSSSSSSSGSEEDQLLSLQQILEGSAKPPDTPEKGAYSTPGTPVSKPLPTSVKSVIYRNTLDDMLKEKESNQRVKDMEMNLDLSFAEDLMRLDEEEQSDENMQEAISNKQKEFQRQQCFSLLSSAIRDLHPGEEVFCLSYFGRLFNQHTLKLRQFNDAATQGTAQTVLGPDQLRFQLGARLLQAAYQSCPCPPQVARWLFQMMSVHTEKSVSDKILQALQDIARSAAEHIVVNKSHQFEVWVPSVGDVTLVFMNMGVPYVTLFPLASLQPSFTEGDLLEGIQIDTESLSSKKELCAFPEHNFENVLKYLCDVTALCPRAYSDTELLLLLTLVSKVGLETQLTLLPTEHLSSLEHNLVNNMRDWDHMLPQICVSLTALAEHHHNLRWLVQLLPDNTRGLQLRRHLSVMMISKLLNQRCTYTPTNTEFKLSDLRPYLRHMRPSTLFKSMQPSRKRPTRGDEDDDDDPASLDQQAYYLCYSLLALANEASNFEFFPPNQKDQLLLLCSELEKHIKCDIRESKKCLYRSKVKDFVARIYTKWQVLLQRTRPLQGKLYDYWQPLPEEIVTSSQEGQSTEGDEEEEEEEERDGEGEEACMEVEVEEEE